jgi:hypothetical protein
VTYRRSTRLNAKRVPSSFSTVAGHDWTATIRSAMSSPAWP